MSEALKAIVFVALILLLKTSNGADLVVGVGTHLGQEKIGSAQARFLLETGNLTGFRDELYWHRLEREPGNILVGRDLAELDHLIKAMATKSPALLILDYGNKFYGFGRQPSTIEERNAFVRYSLHIARRYRGQVYGYEIWNEWNIGAGNPKPSPRFGDPTDYVALVRSVAPAIRQEDPQAKIVCGAVADRDTEWVEVVLQLGILKDCDSFSVHPYVFSNGSQAEPRHAFGWVDRVRHLVERYADGVAKTISITELGWPNHIGIGGTRIERATAYLAQSLFLARERPWIDGIWWYELVDSGVSNTNKEHNFGLVRNDLSAKPAFVVMKAIAPIVSKGQRLKSGYLDSRRYKITLSMPAGDEVTAMWTVGGGRRNFLIRSVADHSQLEAIVGSLPSLTNEGERVEVGEMPLVIRHPKDAISVE